MAAALNQMGRIGVKCYFFYTSFFLALFNAMQEGKDNIVYSFGIALWTLVLLLAAHFLFQKSQKRRKDRWGGSLFFFSERLVWILTIIGFVVYILNGASDPNTAGHMHVILFPILLFLVSLALVAVSWLLILLPSSINKSK